MGFAGFRPKIPPNVFQADFFLRSSDGRASSSGCGKTVVDAASGAGGGCGGIRCETWSEVNDRPQEGITACEGEPSATPIAGEPFCGSGGCGFGNVALFGASMRGDGVGKLKISSPALISIVWPNDGSSTLFLGLGLEKLRRAASAVFGRS